MTTASHDQIVELLGDVDELIVKRIEETGASIDEIGEALSDLQDDGFAARPPASSARVVEVRAILAEMLDDPDQDLDEDVADRMP
jgi:DNA-binding transcriptional MerR regulator